MTRFARIAAFFVFAAFALASSFSAHAAASAWAGDKRAEVRLVTAADNIAGNTLQAGVEFRYPPGWHGYWRTPGDAGIAPQFDWSASSNVSDAAVAWPAPSRLVIAGLQNSVYTGNFVLPIQLNVEDPNQSARLALTLDYATCSNVCVPEHAELMLALQPGNGAPSAESPAIAAALRTVPQAPAAAGIEVARSRIDNIASGERLHVDLRSASVPFHAPDLFVEGAGAGLPRPPQVRLFDHGRRAVLQVDLPPSAGAAAPLQLTVVDGARAVQFDGPHPAIGAAAGQSIAAILALALLGGLILNFMPCVLPVLSIKVFSVVKAAGAERSAARHVALATAVGIVTSFLLLAAALSGLKLAGASLGWGIQFQQPWFLAGMAVVTTLFAASFFDWLQIGLPRVLADLGAGTPSRGPLVEAFIGGMLATLLATPCSAPFVGTAVGFALTKSPLEIVAVLAMLGAGMALPFMMLALFPSLAARLPRPGHWMNHLRKATGVLLLATAVWLLTSLWTVAGATVTALVATVLAALLAMRALLAALQRPGTARWSGIATGVLSAAAIALAILPMSSAPARQTEAAGWQAFDPRAIDAAVASGKTVLVDVTASWCLTCKVNELTVLDTASVRERLARGDIVRMQADWSHYDPAIAGYVQSFGRFGIPLDVVYGPLRPEGQLLPEVLQSATLLHVLDDVRAQPQQKEHVGS